MVAAGRNEADRLRVILETLAYSQPELKLEDALPVIWEIEKRTFVLESPDVTARGSDPASVAAWIALPSNTDIRDYITDGKTINAIKDVRAGLGIGLKEAKDGVEYYRDHVA